MDVTTNASDAAITMAIIAIAKKLHFEVLAEGVETEEQLFFLQENQCDSCQGFLFSKPITAAQMTNLLMRDSSVALKHRRIIDKFYSIKADHG
jgi:EAL domain-containing protein (putative c-di-GMP-specific phosphodiesterase class I)